MIIKSFELDKIKSKKSNLILMYGLNQGYKNQIKAIDLSAVNFSTSKAFNLNTIIIIYALVCIYVAFA